MRRYPVILVISLSPSSLPQALVMGLLRTLVTALVVGTGVWADDKGDIQSVVVRGQI